MINNKVTDIRTNFRASGCFCLVGDEVLVIQRQRRKSFPMHWAIPTGKIEAGEAPRQCMVRELHEELGIRVEAEKLQQLSDFIVQEGDTAFEYVAFVLILDKHPHLILKKDEVRIAMWVKVDRVLKRRVVPYFYNTLHDLLDWKHYSEVQWRLMPEPEAKSAKRRGAGSKSKIGVRRAAASSPTSGPIRSRTGADLFGKIDDHQGLR